MINKRIEYSIIIPVWRGALGTLPRLFESIPEQDGIEIIEDEIEDVSWEDLLADRSVISHYAGVVKPWQLQETPWDYAWLACAKRVPSTPELARWIARCGERQAPPWTYRTDDVRNAGQVLLYGYSHFSRFLCETLQHEGYGNIRCFLDRDPQKQGSSFRGIPCLGPELLDDLREDALIVICAQTAWQGISAQLQARGIPQDRLARYRSRDHALISV